MKTAPRPPRALPLLAASVLAAVGSSACGSDSTGPGTEEPGFDPSPLRKNVAVHVVTATYLDFAAAADALADATVTLQADPGEANLAAARRAWQAAREPWEASEAFLFGPVEDLGVDPGVDSWPVNRADLDAVLASDDELTPEYVAGLEGGLKGFHVVEYLLWGADAARTADLLTPRELQYLVSSSANLAQLAHELSGAWDPSGSMNYAGRLAGTSDDASQYYAGPRAALQELLGGMIAIADEVANGKINGPFAGADPTRVESQFSHNSILDFQNNIRSILHVWTGAYGDHDGAGFDELVRHDDATLATDVEDQIHSAIDAIGAIPPPFRDAISENRDAVAAAQQSVRTLEATLQERVAPLLSGP